MIVRDVLKGVPVLSLEGRDDADIAGIAYASAAAGPGFLFAALKGARADGYDFAAEAVGRGAIAVLSDRPKPAGLEAVWIRVFDPRQALALASANFYRHPSRELKVVGVTGTKGKTTITYLLEAILEAAGLRCGVLGTIAYRGPGLDDEAPRTTPEAPDLQRFLRILLDAGATHVVMEVSSHALDLKRVVGVSFDVAVFTNLSGEHLDYHRTMEEYFAAKKRLFVPNAKTRVAVVNEDDEWGRRLVSELPLATITFGLSPAALVRGERVKTNGAGIEALVRYPGGQAVVTSPLSGRHNLSNILAAFAAALALNVPPRAIREGLARLSQVPGRLERIETRLGFLVFVDYAHTDSALRSLLETARDLKPGRIVLVFGAGGDRDRSKRPRMGEVAGALADRIILTSDNPRSEDPLAILREIEAGVIKAGRKDYEIVPDRREAIARALESARPGDCVLIAGKGHERYQVIGDETLPFSDVEVAREILARLEAA